MLTSKFIRENFELVKENLKKRNNGFDLSEFLEKEKERLRLIQISEEKKSQRNKVSKEIGVSKRHNNDKELDRIKEEMKELGGEITVVDQQLRNLQKEMDLICSFLPNILAEEVPAGVDDSENKFVRGAGEPTEFDFSPKDHVFLLEKNGMADFERARKISGARFAVLKNDGARLERALINFFLDENIKAGYTEFHPPVIVNDRSLFGTGNLPKFQEDLFILNNEEIDYDGKEDDEIRKFYLIPTAEVPLTNLHADEILSVEELPKKYTSYTNCFRSEAGSAGRDTQGLIRVHQFGKVEMVNITHPEQSEQAHESMVAQAELLLKKLGLPYRVVLLCSGDTGFSARKCYDLEVWLPGQNKYREISSCSNCWDFQATRAKIRFKNKNDKPQFVHTLNGSGLPIGRALVAILENYQKADGSIKIPEVLIPYFGKTTSP